MVIEVQLLWPIVVGEIDVWPTIAVEISRRRCQCPPRTPHAHAIGDVLELAAAEVVEEQILAAVVGELEAVVHDPRRREVPEVDVVAEVGRDVQIEQTIAIVVEPDRAVAVHPAVEAGRFGHLLEVRAVDVSDFADWSSRVDHYNNLDLAPSLIAREARRLEGSSRERALDAYTKARELAAIAPRLSLDPAATIFQIGGILADVAGPASLKR